MAKNENRRRKKLETKRRRSADKKRQAARQISTGTAGAVAAAKGWPIIASLVSDPGLSVGLQSAMIARKSPSGRIVAGVFFVDTHCLGVKDTMAFFGTQREWDNFCERLEEQFELLEVAPQHVCGFVQQAVAYAKSLNLNPHSDYLGISQIFGDLDPSECMEEFRFGCDGRPRFTAGPFDSPARCRYIVETLRQTVGEGNFDYILPFHADYPGDLPAFDLADFDSPEVPDQFEDPDVQSIEASPQTAQPRISVHPVRES